MTWNNYRNQESKRQLLLGVEIGGLEDQQRQEYQCTSDLKERKSGLSFRVEGNKY